MEERYARWEIRSSPDGEERWLNWAVREKDGGSVIGTVQATVRKDRSALLAYVLGAAHWGRGFAAEACREVLRSLESDFGVAKAIAEVDTRNESSLRVLERLGLSRIGLKRNADFFKGAPSDEWIFAGVINKLIAR